MHWAEQEHAQRSLCASAIILLLLSAVKLSISGINKTEMRCFILDHAQCFCFVLF